MLGGERMPALSGGTNILGAQRRWLQSGTINLLILSLFCAASPKKISLKWKSFVRWRARELCYSSPLFLRWLWYGFFELLNVFSFYFPSSPHNFFRHCFNSECQLLGRRKQLSLLLSACTQKRKVRLPYYWLCCRAVIAKHDRQLPAGITSV